MFYNIGQHWTVAWAIQNISIFIRHYFLKKFIMRVIVAYYLEKKETIMYSKN